MKGHIVALLTIASVASFSTFLSASGSNDSSLDDVMTQWLANQNAASKLRLSWSSRRTITKESFPASKQGGGRSPAADTTLAQEFEIIMDGDMLRAKATGDDWSADADAVVPYKRDAAYDGHLWRAYRVESNGHAGGSVLTVNEAYSFLSTEYLAIALIYRPFMHHWLDFDKRQIKVSDQKGIVDGKECIVLEQVEAANNLARKWWVDRSNKFAVLRFTEGTMERVAVQVDIRYATNASGIPVPKEWKTIEFYSSSNVVKEIDDCKATAVDLNVSPSRDMFVFDFPIGAHINDVDKRSAFIVKAGGVRRTITAAEVDAGYDQWLSTDSGKARPVAVNRPYAVFYRVGLAVTACVIVIVIAIRALRSRSKPETKLHG